MKIMPNLLCAVRLLLVWYGDGDGDGDGDGNGDGDGFCSINGEEVGEEVKNNNAF